MVCGKISKVEIISINAQRYFPEYVDLRKEEKMNSIQTKNNKLIGERLDKGLALLRRYYDVQESNVDPILAHPMIGGRPHHARRFDIKGVGNLLIMTVTEAEENQLSSFVIMPYAKNLPLFSTDYVYSGEKRYFLLEIYDLTVKHDKQFIDGIDAFRAFGVKLEDMKTFPTRQCWYDNIRPVCYAKAPTIDQDDLAIQRFLEFLQLFISMEQKQSELNENERKEKWERNRSYADRLIDEGGVSTDLFTQALGAENTRRFFHQVFFGADWYKPVSVQLRQIDAFLEHVDRAGISNREKINRNQHIIQRLDTTDKTKSYEDAGKSAAAEEEQTGAVVEDGKLIGFGIHILNEDIYPLQRFRIFLRNCGLAGKLDLSGCADLLFVDVYHNQISAIDVSGAKSVRILGVQDNQIDSLNTADLTACQGIDAGMNHLRSLQLRNNQELVELYINDNQFTEIDLRSCPKLKYFYCHNNFITELDTTSNPLLRHLNATGNPLKQIRSLAPQRDERLPLELKAEGNGTVGLKFNPVYNAQWKETGEWQQTYFAYPQAGHTFTGWYDENGRELSTELEWQDQYGTSRLLTARFK